MDVVGAVRAQQAIYMGELEAAVAQCRIGLSLAPSGALRTRQALFADRSVQRSELEAVPRRSMEEEQHCVSLSAALVQPKGELRAVARWVELQRRCRCNAGVFKRRNIEGGWLRRCCGPICGDQNQSKC
jgi:hypothetical protein